MSRVQPPPPLLLLPLPQPQQTRSTEQKRTRANRKRAATNADLEEGKHGEAAEEKEENKGIPHEQPHLYHHQAHSGHLQSDGDTTHVSVLRVGTGTCAAERSRESLSDPCEATCGRSLSRTTKKNSGNKSLGTLSSVLLGLKMECAVFFLEPPEKVLRVQKKKEKHPNDVLRMVNGDWERRHCKWGSEKAVSGICPKFPVNLMTKMYWLDPKKATVQKEKKILLLHAGTLADFKAAQGSYTKTDLTAKMNMEYTKENWMKREFLVKIIGLKNNLLFLASLLFFLSKTKKNLLFFFMSLKVFYKNDL